MSIATETRQERQRKTQRKPKLSRRGVTVRASAEELEQLHQRAENFGYKSLSQYLLERGLKEGEMIQSVDREALERVLYEIRKVGHNINQIARQMHKGYSEYSQAYLDRAMREVERVVSEARQELER